MSPQMSTRANASNLRPVAEIAPSKSYEISEAVLMTESPNKAAAESIRTLRTHIMAQHIGEGRRALAVCGPSEGVGCSFIATNLAVSLSQIGINTLLIEGDLRRPSLQSFIRPARTGPGLAQCLRSDDITFGEAIQRDVLPNLSLLYSGGPAASPQELLGGERFQALVEFCLREFDVTIIDTPPANTCADARRISSVVGYSLIVTRRHKTFVDDVKTLAAQLEADQAKVVGTVLNEG
jgi:capsular exopolysaccharide synthesis family protein